MTVIIEIAVTILIVVLTVKEALARNRVLKCFKTGDVNVSGIKGSGKDMLFSWVINKRKRAYISNINYTDGKMWYPLEWEKLDIKNSRKELISGKITPYTYPYPDGTDVYLSDVGVLLPSWDCNNLNKEYPRLPLYMALSRHLGDCAIHTNSQAPNRPWDKLREQQDFFIVMKETKVRFKKFVTMRGRIYTSYDSACKKTEPWKGGRGGKARMDYNAWRANNGEITKFTIHCTLPKNSYNTRAYKEILEGKEQIKEEQK